MVLKFKRANTAGWVLHIDVHYSNTAESPNNWNTLLHNFFYFTSMMCIRY